MDRMALPASAMPAIAEPVMRAAFANARMADQRDWAGVLRCLSAMNPKTVETVLESLQ